MSDDIPTVQVVNPAKPGEYMTINACDMTAEHVLFRGPAELGERVPYSDTPPTIVEEAFGGVARAPMHQGTARRKARR
jgi:hypothetical protein